MSQILTNLILLAVSGTTTSFFVYKHFILQQHTPSLGDGINMFICAILWFLYGRNFIRNGKWVRSGYASLILCGSSCTLAVLSFAEWL